MRSTSRWAGVGGLLLGLALPLASARAQVNIPMGELWEGTKKGLELGAKAGELGSDLGDLADEYENLSEAGDVELDPEGMPRVPSLCAESEACEVCYRDAQGRLRFVRAQFERLRLRYQTTRSFALSAVAFGDNVSGIHAVSGLAWQSARADIMESLRQFGETYDEQYERGIDALREALRKLGRCEAEFGGEEDWYDRYGFIYYTFMKDRYRRSSVE